MNECLGCFLLRKEWIAVLALLQTERNTSTCLLPKLPLPTASNIDQPHSISKNS
jgi:hypothetical protein